MTIAVESLLFLLGGVVLAVLLIQVFGRGGAGKPPFTAGTAALRLERQVGPQADVEETRLLINDNVILTASSAGLRLADYADEVAQLETIATRIASALGASVELTRLGGRSNDTEAGVPVRHLPRHQQGGAP